MIFTGFKSELFRHTEEIATFSHAESSQIRWLSSLISDNVPPALHMHEVQYLEAIARGKRPRASTSAEERSGTQVHCQSEVVMYI